MTKTTITFQELGRMEPAAFLAYIRQYPHGSQWESHEAWRYASGRLARIQGLVVVGKQSVTAVTGNIQ